jgi:hypothetical protein
MAGRVLSVASVCAATIISASSAGAQLIRGRVVDAGTGRGLPAADVVALDAAGARLAATVCDSSGAFALRLPAAGLYRLHSRSLGYAGRISAPVQVGMRGDVAVMLPLGPSPVLLDTLTATATRQVPFLVQEGFYRREAKGWGYFLDRDARDRRGDLGMAIALDDLPGVRLIGSHDVVFLSGTTMFLRGGCMPSVVLDGIVLRAGGTPGRGSLSLAELLKPFNLEAVEVYPSPAGVPVEYAGSVSPCGAIIAWSRR